MFTASEISPSEEPALLSRRFNGGAVRQIPICSTRSWISAGAFCPRFAEVNS
jgi:hypothetical protein